MIPDLPFSGVAAAAQGLRSGAISAVELAEIALRRIESANPRLGALTEILAATARQEAEPGGSAPGSRACRTP